MHGEQGGIGTFTVALGYRPPYRFGDMLAFYRARALGGVEVVGAASYARTVRMPDGQGGEVFGWLEVEDDPARHAVRVTMSESLFPVVMHVLARVRCQFDLDGNPAAIQAGLASLERVVPGAVTEGVRLPGCFDPFETSCRAILGQQISVAAANKLAARIVENFGCAVEAGVEGLSRAFPAPRDVLGIEDIEDAFGNLGVIKTRTRVIAELALLVEAGEVDFANGDAPEVMERLLAVKGIGPWSANYIAMRCMSYSDAFMETDAGVKHALPDLTPAERLALAEQWRPWRSYATICLWNSLA